MDAVNARIKADVAALFDEKVVSHAADLFARYRALLDASIEVWPCVSTNLVPLNLEGHLSFDNSKRVQPTCMPKLAVIIGTNCWVALYPERKPKNPLFSSLPPLNKGRRYEEPPPPYAPLNLRVLDVLKSSEISGS